MDSGATSTLILLARRALDATISADSEFMEEGEVGLGGAALLRDGGGDAESREGSKLEGELSGEVDSDEHDAVMGVGDRVGMNGRW